MTDPAAVRDRLAAAVAPGGGWGYVPGQPAHLEPTALAVLALHADPDRHAAAISGGFAALAAHADPDGSYRLTRGRPQAVWPTALALFAHTRTTGQPAGVADRLLAVEGRVVKLDPEMEGVTDLDLRLLGWPWAEGTFSWVEPTA
ncbi:MAG: DUF362 domain-containing protein, partial [Fimbriiglobus sp.]